MKRVLFGMTAAGLMAAGSMAAAQTIAPECAAAVAAATTEIPQGYDVVFDAEQGACIASPAAGTVPPTEGALGAGAGAALAGAAVLTFIAISTTGGT